MPQTIHLRTPLHAVRLRRKGRALREGGGGRRRPGLHRPRGRRAARSQGRGARAGARPGCRGAPTARAGVALRVNGLRTVEGLRDLLALRRIAACASTGCWCPRSRMPPTCRRSQAWAGASFERIAALVETPRGIENAPQRSPHAGGKLARPDARRRRPRRPNSAPSSAGTGCFTRAAARQRGQAAGLQAWDVPHIDLDDPTASRDETRRVARAGLRLQDARSIRSRSPRSTPPSRPRRPNSPGPRRCCRRCPKAMPAAPSSSRAAWSMRRCCARRGASSSCARPIRPIHLNRRHRMVQTAKSVGEKRYRESFGRSLRGLQRRRRLRAPPGPHDHARPTTPGSRC